MIKVDIKYNDSDISKIIISGHAGFDEYGQDIVCAAASTLVTATVNNILSLETTIMADLVKDGLEITVNEITEVNQKILQSMIAMLEELEYDYHENIIIKEG